MELPHVTLRRWVRGFAFGLREMFDLARLFRDDADLYAVVVPLSPDRGWEIVSVHRRLEAAVAACEPHFDRDATVLSHSQAQRWNREVAMRVYGRGEEG